MKCSERFSITILQTRSHVSLLVCTFSIGISSSHQLRFFLHVANLYHCHLSFWWAIEQERITSNGESVGRDCRVIYNPISNLSPSPCTALARRAAACRSSPIGKTAMLPSLSVAVCVSLDVFSPLWLYLVVFYLYDNAQYTRTVTVPERG